MTKQYPKDQIFHILFSTPTKTQSIQEKIRIFLLLPYRYVRSYLKGSIESIMKSDPHCLETFSLIHDCPFYTRNEKMETRSIVGIYFFHHMFLKQFVLAADEDIYVCFAFLFTMIDCIADTFADELEGKLVTSFLGKIDKEAKALKILKTFEEGFLASVDGLYESRKELDKTGINEILSSLALTCKYIYEMHQGSDVDLAMKVREEMKEGIRYIFKSHYESVNTRKRPCKKLLTVEEHVRRSAGAISFYVIFFTGLFGKIQDEHVAKICKSGRKLELLKEMAIEISELTYFVNGYKSYGREFQEGDFSSWVYNYAVYQGYLDPKRILTLKLRSVFNRENMKKMMSKINGKAIENYFQIQTIQRFLSLQKKYKQVVNPEYFLILLYIMRMQILSGGKEEKLQLQEYITQNEHGT